MPGYLLVKCGSTAASCRAVQRSTEPLLLPTLPWELQGMCAGMGTSNALVRLETGNRTGTERFLLHYDAADMRVGAAVISIEPLSSSASSRATVAIKTDDGEQLTDERLELGATAAAAAVIKVKFSPNNSRALPLMGFGTELVWQDASDAGLAAAATVAGSRVLRYPGGTPSNFWDWSCVHKACCTAESLAEGRCEDHGYPKVPPSAWATFVHNSGAGGAHRLPTIFDLNVVQTNASYQLEGLRRFAAAGVPISLIEFGKSPEAASFC
jgi:hypothetical protein